MGEVRSASFVPILRAPETVLYLAKMPHGLLRELLGQERRLRRRHAALRPERGEGKEIKDED